MGVASIEIANLGFQYEQGKSILDSIYISVQKGEAVGIIGANGVGKSTLLKLLVGLERPTQGTIFVDGILLERKNYALIRQKMGYVFQDSDSQLFMNTVYEDVAFAPKNYGLSDLEVKDRVTEALNLVHITHLAEKSIHKLSGGEKKMVSIATILSMVPDIILLDEPTVALDPKNRRNLIHVLNEFSYTKLIASHDLDFIWDTCDRVIILNQGGIVYDGLPQEAFTDKDMLEQNGLELPLSMINRH